MASSVGSCVAALFAQTAVGVAEVEAPSGRFLCGNSRLCRLFGCDEAGLRGLALPDLAPPDDRPTVTARLEALAVGRGTEFSMEVRRETEDGPTTWSIVTVATTAGEDAPHRRLIVIAQDISPRKTAQDSLRTTEDSFRRAVVESPVPVMLHAEDGAVIQVSRSWCEMTGYGPDELRTIQDWTERAYGERKEPVMAGIDALYALEHRRHGGDFTVRIKDGSTRIWEFTSAPLGRLPDGRRLVVSVAQDVTERRRAESELRDSEGRLRAVLDATPFPVAVVNLQADCIRFWSRSAHLTFGHTADTAPEWYRIAYPDPDYRRQVIERFTPFLETARTSGRPVNTGEYRVTCADGSVRLCEIYATFLADSLIVTFNDVTERRRAEEDRAALQAQLLQSQKMETIGRLAGGVAHDFNNLLTAITGNAEFVKTSLEPGRPELLDVEEILHAADRAAALTRQLLAFSRKQVLVVRVFPLQDAVRGMEPMLRRLIGEDIDLALSLDPSTGAVRADLHQLEQVVMNLVVNARKAMPDGGELTVETTNVDLDETYCATRTDVAPGPYVRLSVTDTGCGMAPEVIPHIFEPFFTTRGPGTGTGLGLATVEGIVKQHGGHVAVYSEPGLGSTLHVYMPRVDAPVTAPATPAPSRTTAGTETVLVVEDEAALLAIAARLLREQGYTVLEASGPAQALTTAAAHPGHIHLLLTDVVMPAMNGKALSLALTAERPTLRTLFMSGYTDNAIVHHGILDSGTPFIAKPFTPAALARKVRDVLDGSERI